MSTAGEDEDAGRECPYCKEEIRADAVKCPHCRSVLGKQAASHGGTCPYCKEDIHPEAVVCKHCGSWLDEQGSGSTARQVGAGGRAAPQSSPCTGCGGGMGAGLGGAPFAARAGGWRIPIGPIVIGSEGDNCIYIDNTATHTFCIICPTLTSCWNY